MSRQLLLATRNLHKLREVREILAGTDFEVVSIADVADIPDIVEDGDSFQANADEKARTLAKVTGRTAIAALREGFLGVAHAQTNHLQTPPAVQTRDRGPSLHFSPARACGRRSHLSDASR